MPIGLLTAVSSVWVLIFEAGMILERLFFVTKIGRAWCFMHNKVGEGSGAPVKAGNGCVCFVERV